MKKFQWHKKSIVSFFTTLTIILVLVQMVILVSLLIYGGIFEQAKLGSYKALNETVTNRLRFIQQEMGSRWTNIDPYLPELSVSVSKQTKTANEKLDLASDTLTRMLRLTEATGVYLILNDPDSNNNQRSTLYLRSYAPQTSSSKNDDIHLVYGPSDIASKYQFPLDSTWRYYLTLTDENRSFYEKPISYHTDTLKPTHLGYWSSPFKLSEDDIPIITYSIPLTDVNNQIVGVVGIELSISYLIKFLPMSEIQPRDSLGYVIAKKDTTSDHYTTMITTNNIQKRFLAPSQKLEFEPIDSDFSIFQLQNNQTKNDIYASISKMNLYEYNSPFQDSEWYLIGFIASEHLLNYMNQSITIVIMIVLVLLVISVIGAVFISRQMSKPVVDLANQVDKLKKTETLV